MIKNITIGSDPEFFIYEDQKPKSSIGLITGTKWKPTTFNGYGVLKDNVLIEGNIPPSKTRGEFVTHMKNWKDLAQNILGKNLKLVSADSVEFPEEALDSLEARTFGCAPYFNAWTLDLGDPSDLANMNFRVAGTHIHIGYEIDPDVQIDRFELNIAIVRAFDYFVTYPSRKEHDDPVRALYYGDFGNYRDKEYGVECRSLGGYFSKDEYLPWIYDQTIKALKYCSNMENIKLLKQIESPEENTEENYKTLNINLNEQLYDRNHTTTAIQPYTELSEEA